jgi:hypothetical protein
MPKKKPRKRSKKTSGGIAFALRRTAVWFITASAISI